MMPLPRPTPELILAEGKLFDIENELPENALKLLVQRFPENTRAPEVLLKVVAINNLYSTNVYDVERVACHITSLPLDELLKSKSPDAVARIADFPLGKAKVFLSFATKYCNWHAPDAYPIFDSNVDRALWEYKKRDNFMAGWAYNDLESGTGSKRYNKFLAIVSAFREHYGLSALSFKDIDKFLYRIGRQPGSTATRE